MEVEDMWDDDEDMRTMFGQQPDNRSQVVAQHNTSNPDSIHAASDELVSALESLIDRCNNSTDSCNWDEVIAAEAVLERIYKSRSKEKP